MSKILASVAVVLALLSCNNDQPEGAGTTLVKSATATAQPMAAEFAEARYSDMGKATMQSFISGSLDAWGEGLADNVVYQYSSGDTIVGKQAVLNYWKERRATVLDNLAMANDIWLSIKVNTPQKGPDMPGVWVMNWSQLTAKYRNGKTVQFGVHQDMHYNEQDKVDRVILYIDRAPINAALAAK